jgi:BTB And C-terminal Kelch/BTB/POZ domain/Domain of unknown function (DUF4734)
MDCGDNKFSEKRLRFTNQQNVENIPEILERWFKKEGLVESLEQMVTNMKNTDFVVRIADRKFGCHLLVLQCCSEFFQNLDTTGGEVTISEQEVSVEAFQKIYEWMLTESCLLAVGDLLALLKAANHLEILELQSQCWLHIDNEDLFHEHSAFLFYWKGRHLPMADIRDIMLNRIGRFFLSLVACREFVELGLDEVTILLRSNLVGVHTEAEILFAAVRWLYHDWADRKRHMLDIMKCVRFGLMTSWQLTELQRNCDSARLKMVIEVKSNREPCNKFQFQILNHPEVLLSLKQGISVAVSRGETDPTASAAYLEKLNLNLPSARTWIRDIIWLNLFGDTEQTSYKAFNQYLSVLQTKDLDHWRTLKIHHEPFNVDTATPLSFVSSLQSLDFDDLSIQD